MTEIDGEMLQIDCPIVSVLLPVRDGISGFRECIASVQAQTLANFELLVVDDGSRDGSAALVAELAEVDRRIRLLTRPRLGLVPALNAGLAAARAPLVARMDADDLMHPRRLELQCAHLARQPGLAAVGCRVHAFPALSVGAGMREYLRWQNTCVSERDIADERYVESPLSHPSVVFRRDVVIGLGGYRNGDFPEDYELWLRMLHAGHHIAKVPQVLLDWCRRADSHSRTDHRYSRAAFDQLRADYLARDPRLTQTRPLVIWGAGRRTRQRCRRLLDQGFAPSAWIDIDPRKLGRTLDEAPVHPPEWLAGQAPRPLVLVYVTNHGARELIASCLRRMGYARGRDYLMIG